MSIRLLGIERDFLHLAAGLKQLDDGISLSPLQELRNGVVDFFIIRFKVTKITISTLQGAAGGKKGTKKNTAFGAPIFGGN